MVMDKKNLPIIPFERIDDLHNLDIADSSDLVLFMAGNQFMAMQEIVESFQKEYPDIERIFKKPFPLDWSSSKYYPVVLCSEIKS